jgi:hypothetical protein
MAFKNITSKKAVLDSIEEMYVDYKSRKIKGPIDHQTDMLRKYAQLIRENPEIANVSLELPTGSGKTLVGLLVAEWRRRKFGERVLYLCPTRQLVTQVEDQSKNHYGINVSSYTGKIKEYSQEVVANYRENKTVSIATYSALFNTNSFFSEVDTVVFDDAHSSEGYISSLWTVEVTKKTNPDLYESIATILRPKIPAIEFIRMTEDSQTTIADMGWVEKLPVPFFIDLKDEIFSCVDSYTKGHPQDSIKYAWSVVRDKLHACNLFYSVERILIRPLIPPTETLPVFNRIKHRIFMSATLGEGGDLERITGVGKITRIECPEKWKKRAIGRRLFFFPDIHQSENKTQLCSKLIKEAGRALIITSSEGSVNEIQKELKPSLKGYSFVSAKQFEEDPNVFTSNNKAVLFFANRYDGVDLADDKCRLLILENLSKGLNLQDKFILERLGASSNYHDRIRTKITQMIGRCTRSETDYSLVVVTGQELTDFFYNKKYRNLLHPEIQAEIIFGVEQSDADGVDNFLDNFKIFLKQNEEWQDADAAIADIRDESKMSSIVDGSFLQEAASLEVECQYHLWNEHYTDALDAAKSIVGVLSRSKLERYTGFWNYITGNIEYLIDRNSSKSNNHEAVKYYKEFSKAAGSISWVGRMILSLGSTSEFHFDKPDLSEQVNRLASVQAALGVAHNGNFDRRVQKILDYTVNGDSKAFEEAQCLIGELLGFVSGKQESDASPDPWWVLSEEIIVVFEDHSEGKETGALGATKARQASTHHRWIKQKLQLKDSVKIIQVLITPKVKFMDGAEPHLDGIVSVWQLSDYKKWVTGAIASVRKIRSEFDLNDIVERAEIGNALKAYGLDAQGITSKLDSLIYKQKR